MEVIRIAEQPLKTTPRGVKARLLVDRAAVNVVNLVLSPGEEVPSHVTPVDVLFYVIEGKGRVIIGDETAEVSEGDVVVSPAHIPHALQADATSNFSVLVIKTPNPKIAG